MCGRFTLSRPGEVLDETLDLLEGLVDPPANESIRRRFRADLDRMGARYNVAPTQPVAALLSDRRGRLQMELLRWGFVGSPAAAATASPTSGRPRVGSRSHINARAESMATKPTFEAAYRSHRCTILADGFYEWKKSSRQPFLFSPTLRSGFCFAGLWTDLDHRSAPPKATADAPGAPRRGCCIVTTRANEVVAPIHDRMPVILVPEALRLWLDAEVTDPKILGPLLEPVEPSQLARRPVSSRVNRVALDDASLIEAVAEAPADPENLTLF